MAEETVYIPNFAYPFKNIKEEKDCYDKLGSSIKGNYLFSAQGLWHGGVHFGSSFNKEIRAIADGELVAYRLSKKYLQNEDDKNAVEEVEKNKGFYSTGFFLLKHTIAYPKTNKLTFFSLYMHTAKKDEYVLDTHKVKGTDRFLRKGVSYADEDKLEELAVDTKITINASQTEEEKTKKRYKVLYVGDTKRTDNATIHKSNIEALDAVLKIKTINKDTPANESVQFPTTSIKIQAGEVIGLKGVYSPATQNKDEVTHIEVFSGDDIQAFADTAKQTYATDTSEDRPIPTKITVPKDTTLYELKEQQIVNSSDGTATIKAYTTSGIVTTCNGSPTCNALVNKTEIEVDTSAVVCTYRHKITKIEDQEITDDWSIYKNSIGKTDVPRKKTTEPKKQAEEKTFKLKGLKRRLYKDKVYLYIDDTTLVLYDDCKEQHPITFEWAGIIKNKSQDKFSIFEDITPMFSKEGELQMSSMYSELFREMDKLVDNPNEKLEPQEISTAAGNLKVKKLTSRMIVQHSSEWDSDIHMADAILKIMKEHKDKLKNYEDLKKHYENEKIRIENLEFFSKCQTENVTGFPTSDVVYHLNPIELVAEFGKNGCLHEEQFRKIFPDATEAKRKEVLKVFNKYCQVFEISTPLRVAHFFAQVKEEVGDALVGKEESLWYKTTALKSIFKRYFKNFPAEADALGYKGKISTSVYAALSNEEKNKYTKAGSYYYTQLPQEDEIAKRVYCCNGQGNYFTDCTTQGGCNEGLLYKGKGFIQLTWKSNYKAVNDIIKLKMPNENIDIVTNPNSVLETKIGMLSAMGFWEMHKLNKKADNGTTDSAVNAITAVVNKNTDSKQQRRDNFKAINKILKG